MTREFKLLPLINGEHRYAFFFDPSSARSVLETLMMVGRFAMNPDLNFSWGDAAVKFDEIGELVQQAKAGAGT